MRIKLNLLLFLILYFINIINAEPIWKITFCNKEDVNAICSNQNNITIIKGNYQTIQIKIEQNNLINNSTITHIHTKLKLNHLDLKMIPNELIINTEESREYYIDLGIKCNSDLNSTKLSFDIEDDDIKDLLEISECKVNLIYSQKIIYISILNNDYITNTLYGKFYLQQDFKNFEDINIHFNYHSQYLEKIQDMNIYSYNYTYDRLIYYSLIKPNIEQIKRNDKEFFNCGITLTITNTDNSKCFKIDNKAVQVSYYNKTVDYSNKESFYHNSIVSSYIDKNKEEENSLSFYFFKEVFYFVSYCAIQDINNDFLSDYEILNQRLNYNNNISASFNISEFKSQISEIIITFKNLNKYTNYKIKCIFDFMDNKTIELTYGEGMLIPMKINFNETKSIVSKNCMNEAYLKNKLDTRKCDIIEKRLIFEIFHDMNHKYKLQYFNYTDFKIYNEKNQEEKIEHITNIINNNNTITSSQIDLISILSDYLFILDCKENIKCQNEKDILFHKILTEYDKIEIEKIDILNNEQSVLNDILLFNNIIQNTDSINYENFEFLVNNIFNKRKTFFSKSIKNYNHYLTNYFLLIFDKFISIIYKFKSIYKNKFLIDDKVNIIKSDLLIQFYHLFIGWISNGMLNREERLHQFCRNLIVNYVETPVKSNVKIIMNSNGVSIVGFETESSKKLYKNIASAGGILYKEFPLFPLDNKKSEAVTFFLYTELRENFENQNIAYEEAFKIIFMKKDSQNFCYLWNNDYLIDKKEIVNNFISTEYLNEDDNSNYNISCISRIMISPMTVILGQNDIKGKLYKEGINFFSIIVIILITICLIIVSLPFVLSKYYSKHSNNKNRASNELI